METSDFNILLNSLSLVASTMETFTWGRRIILLVAWGSGEELEIFFGWLQYS